MFSAEPFVSNLLIARKTPVRVQPVPVHDIGLELASSISYTYPTSPSILIRKSYHAHSRYAVLLFISLVLILMLKSDVKISSLFNVKGKIGMFGLLDMLEM